MNEQLPDSRTDRFELRYRIEAPAGQGDLKSLLGTAIELQYTAGIVPHSLEYVTFNHDGGAVYTFIDYDPADVRKLLAGKMTEHEYFTRHSLTKLSQ